MTENSIVKSVVGFAAAACVMLAFVFFDADVRSQNTNSNTTTQENSNTNTAEPTEGTVEGEATPRPEIVINRDAAPAQDTSGGTQEDLSGTYTGRLNMTGGHEMSGEATLTITGNTFTLEAGGMTHSGRVYAINTRRYVGAAFIFTDLTDPATNTPLAVSARARRTGNRLSLTPVPGARNRMTFNGRSS